MHGNCTTDSSESLDANLAKTLAYKIFIKKKSILLENEEFTQLSQREQEKELMYKSDIYKTMDKMIENIHKYRDDQKETRQPSYFRGYEKTISMMKQKNLENAEAGHGKKRRFNIKNDNNEYLLPLGKDKDSRNSYLMNVDKPQKGSMFAEGGLFQKL